MATGCNHGRFFDSVKVESIIAINMDEIFMRIGFVTTEYVTEANFDGGLANYLQRVSLALQQLEHEPIVIVPSDRNEKIIHKGVEVHRVRCKQPNLWLDQFDKISRFHFRMSRHLLQSSWYLNRYVRQLHAQSPFAVLQYINAYALFRLTEVPCIVRLSSYRPLWQAAGAYPHKHPFHIWQSTFWEYWGMRRADALYAPSEIIAESVKQIIRRPVDVIETPFVLDTLVADSSIYETYLKDKTYLLYFGRLDALKGLLIIADIIYELLDRHTDLYFVFIGKEFGGYQGRPMMELIHERAKNHSNRVLYLGQLRHEQLYPVLTHAHSVVLPSRIDNFPNTCLEAMAHQKVVVGTRGASFEQLLIDGESGFLCELDNFTSLLDNIEKVLNLSDSQRFDIGKKACQRIQELQPEKVVRQLVDYYHETILKYQNKTY